MRISRDDYNHAVAASKPSSMTLRFLDKLFSKETLLRSTLYGTKEFAALDPSRIFAIKSKLSQQAMTFFFCDYCNCYTIVIATYCFALSHNNLHNPIL